MGMSPPCACEKGSAHVVWLEYMLTYYIDTGDKLRRATTTLRLPPVTASALPASRPFSSPTIRVALGLCILAGLFLGCHPAVTKFNFGYAFVDTRALYFPAQSRFSSPRICGTKPNA